MWLSATLGNTRFDPQVEQWLCCHLSSNASYCQNVEPQMISELFHFISNNCICVITSHSLYHYCWGRGFIGRVAEISVNWKSYILFHLDRRLSGPDNGADAVGYFEHSVQFLNVIRYLTLLLLCWRLSWEMRNKAREKWSP